MEWLELECEMRCSDGDRSESKDIEMERSTAKQAEQRGVESEIQSDGGGQKKKVDKGGQGVHSS